MAFNINAHVILSGPKNIKAVTKNIQKQLGTVNARINLKVPKNLSKQLGSFNKGLQSLNKNIAALQSSASTANSHLARLTTQFQQLNTASTKMSKSQSAVQQSLQKTGKEVHNARNEIQAFGKDAALAIRRFAAFTVATGVVFGFVRAIQTATKAAIEYEREIVKIVQVTGASGEKIKGLTSTIQQLSVSLGVDANKLAELGRIFAQTGQSIDQVGDSIRAVARSSLAPSFGEMKNTAEGLIAAMAQFNIAANRSEEVLAGLNAVSKKFAVEAEDLVSVIRRAGGVFSAAAGPMKDPIASLNELIGIFTAVRSTTRESADTIAVGLRTIFTRIQRRGTIDFLKQFNIELVNAKGQFIGLFPAFQQLSKGLDDIIRKGDALTLSAITEELGGVRQVGKLIPAITQFNKALAATKIAGEAAAKGMGKDVALALQPLGKQFELLQQRFNALIRDITQSKTFQNMAKIAISMANAFLSVAEALKPLIPLMTTFAAIKISKGLFDFGAGFVGGLKKGGGAGGAGGALGGAITGGGGGGGGGAATVSNTALISAIKGSVTSQVRLATSTDRLMAATSGLQSTFRDVGYDIAGSIRTEITKLVGVIGNLINALNRAGAVGGLGGGFGRRGGKKFASGGYVHGPSHSQGGVPAVLEGGEYVIPKGYAGGGRIKVGIGKQDYAGMFLQPSGPDQVPGPQTTYTGTLRESGKIAAMINAGGIRSTSGRATNKRGKSPLSGKPYIGVRGNLGTSISRDPAAGLIDPLQDGGGDIAFGNTKKTVGIGKSTFLRAARKAGIFSGPEVDTMRGRGVGVNWKSLSSSQKQRSKTLIAQLGGTLQPGKGYKGVKAEEVGTTIPLVGQPSIFAIDPHHEKDFKQRLRRHWDAMLDETAQVDLDSVAPGMKDMIFERAGGKAVEGHAFEAMLLAFSKQGGFSKSSTEDFDMRGGMGSKSDFAGAVSHLFDPKDLLTQFKWLDAKRSISGDTKASLVKKGANTAAMDPSSGIRLVYEEGGKKTLLRAAGGNVFSPQGTDTVPAMLTPGEFVINRKSAQKIGYGNLKSMNNYAKGGKVQYLKGGGKTTGGGDVVGGDAMGMVFGIQMAVGALAGFTAALAGFDLNAPMTSIMALGMAALQAAGSFALLAPGLGGTLMATKGMKGVMEKLKKPFQDLAKPFKDAGKAAKGTFVSSRTGGSFGDKMAGKGVAPQSITKSLSAGSGKFFKSMKPNWLKVLKGSLTGLPGILASFIVGPLVGAVSGAISQSFFGKKEQIAGTDIEGRTGQSGSGMLGGMFSQGGVSGALESAGSAAGAGMAAAAVTAMIPGLAPLAPVVGGVVAAFKLIEGAVVGAAKQMEFLAFKEMSAAIKSSTEALQRFNEQEIIGTASLKHLNDSLEGTMGAFNKLEAASLNRSKKESSVFEKLAGGIGGAVGGGAGNNAIGKGGAGAVIGLAVGAGAAIALGKAGAALGGTLGSLIPVVGTAAGAIAGALIGGIVGLGIAAFGTDKSLERTSKAFDKAAKTITPEFIEQLDAAFAKASKSMVGNLAVMDKGVLKEMAAVQTVDPSADAKTQSTQAMTGFKQMNQAIDNATSSTGNFTIELRRLTGIKLKAGLIKTVADEASLLGEDGAMEFKAAFSQMRGTLDKEIDQAVQSGDLSGLFNQIDKLPGASKETKDALKNMTTEMFSNVVEQQRLAAVQKLAALAALEARKAFDALAAGLDQFGAKMSAVANNVNRLTSDLQERFGEVTGTKTVGKINQINPFSKENITTASDTTIDAAISQLKSLGPDAATGDVAFKETANMMKGLRDFPLVMRDVVAGLQTQAVSGKGEGVSNTDVNEAVKKGLSDAGINLGAIGEESLFNQLESLGTADRQDGDKLLFSSDKLAEIFAKNGDVTKLLGDIIEKTREKLEQSFSALQDFKNATLEVADIQRKMAQHRLDSELAMLDKQESIRDRVNSALGKAPESFAQAQKALAQRMTTMLSGGVASGEATSFQGNVLDPAALFSRLEQLQEQRARVQRQVGREQGQEITSVASGDTTALTNEYKKNSDKLANLSQEINGTEAALKELANDTRMLAAIEREISKQQQKSEQAKGSALSILDIVDKASRGEMTADEVNKSLSDPITAVNKAFDPNQALDFDEAVDLLKRIESGDPLVAGIINDQFDQLLKQQNIDASTDPEGARALREDFMRGLLAKTAGAGGAILEGAGMPNVAATLERMILNKTAADTEADKLGDVMMKVGSLQVGIMEKTMENQQNQMGKILAQANVGLQKAVLDFQAAVSEFALFRGGVDEGAIAIATQDVQTAKASRDAVANTLKEAEAKEQRAVSGDMSDFTQAGEAAKKKFIDEQRNKKGGLTGKTLETEANKVKEKATKDARAANKRVISDSRGQLEVENHRVKNAEKVLGNAQKVKKTQDNEAKAKSTAEKKAKDEAAKAKAAADAKAKADKAKTEAEPAPVSAPEVEAAVDEVEQGAGFFMTNLMRVGNVFSTMGSATKQFGAFVGTGVFKHLADREDRQRDAGEFGGHSGLKSEGTWDSRRQLKEVHRRGRKELGLGDEAALMTPGGDRVEGWTEELEDKLSKEVAADVKSGKVQRSQLTGQSLNDVNMWRGAQMNANSLLTAAEQKTKSDASGILTGQVGEDTYMAAQNEIMDRTNMGSGARTAVAGGSVAIDLLTGTAAGGGAGLAAKTAGRGAQAMNVAGRGSQVIRAGQGALQAVPRVVQGIGKSRAAQQVVTGGTRVVQGIGQSRAAQQLVTGGTRVARGAMDLGGRGVLRAKQGAELLGKTRVGQWGSKVAKDYRLGEAGYGLSRTNAFAPTGVRGAIHGGANVVKQQATRLGAQFPRTSAAISNIGQRGVQAGQGALNITGRAAKGALGIAQRNPMLATAGVGIAAKTFGGSPTAADTSQAATATGEAVADSIDKKAGTDKKGSDKIGKAVGKEVAGIGVDGCCNDIVQVLNRIAQLLATGGPKSEVGEKLDEVSKPSTGTTSAAVPLKPESSATSDSDLELTPDTAPAKKKPKGLNQHEEFKKSRAAGKAELGGKDPMGDAVKKTGEKGKEQDTPNIKSSASRRPDDFMGKALDLMEVMRHAPDVTKAAGATEPAKAVAKAVAKAASEKGQGAKEPVVSRMDKIIGLLSACCPGGEDKVALMKSIEPMMKSIEPMMKSIGSSDGKSLDNIPNFNLQGNPVQKIVDELNKDPKKAFGVSGVKEQPAPLTKSIEQPAQKSWLGQISDKVQGVVDWGKVKFAKGMAKINKTSPFDTVDPHAAARLNRKELGIKERANLTKGIEGKTTKIDRLKGLLESGRSSSGNFLTDANKHNIRRNITKAEESRAKMQDRLGPSTEAQKKKAEEAAAKETLAAQQKRQGQPSEEPWPTTSGEAKARWDKKQPVKTSVRTATAGAGGGAFAEVERIMEGTTFISSLDGAFVKGADYAAQQLKEAFKSLDSTTIELKTTLGAPIQVHLIAGEGVKKLQVDLDKLKSRLDNELNKGINADGSNPDPSMDSNSAARGS